MGDQSGRGGIAAGHGVGAVDDRQQARGEFLAQLDAPLVERIDVVDRRFDENAMLVERDQATKRERIEPAIGERDRGPIAGKFLVRRQRLGLARCAPLLAQLRDGLGVRAAAGQRLGLREAIRDEQMMMLREIGFMA